MLFYRCVNSQKVDDLQWRNDSYLATECSASTETVEITKVFNVLISKVSDLHEIPLDVGVCNYYL